MFARLEFNLCHEDETKLVLYRSKKDVGNPDKCALMHIDLDNKQLTTLLVVAKIKPVDMNK